MLRVACASLDERPLGGSGACSPRRFLDFRPSEIVAGAMLGEILGALGPPRLLHLPVRKPLVARGGASACGVLRMVG